MLPKSCRESYTIWVKQDLGRALEVVQQEIQKSATGVADRLQ